MQMRMKCSNFGDTLACNTQKFPCSINNALAKLYPVLAHCELLVMYTIVCSFYDKCRVPWQHIRICQLFEPNSTDISDMRCSSYTCMQIYYCTRLEYMGWHFPIVVCKYIWQYTFATPLDCGCKPASHRGASMRYSSWLLEITRQINKVYILYTFVLPALLII